LEQKLWPSDLLFDPIQPMIKLDPDIIKPNILSKFEKVLVKTVFAAFGKRNTIKPFLNFERLFVNQCDNQVFL